MYTIPKDTKIDKDVLLEIIRFNDKKQARYNKLDKYYLGEHDILTRVKKELYSNNRVMVNHAKYITDTNVGYLMGNPVEYQASEEYDITPLQDAYKSQTINNLDNEIAKAISIFGKTLEYVYANEKTEPRSAEIDNRNGVLVHDTTFEHNKLFGIIYRPIYKLNEQILDYYEVIYCDNKEIIAYKLSNDSLTVTEKAKPHAFGDVPMIEYANNPEYQGDFEQVLTLIDAYNTLQSDRINDKEQLVDAILMLYGFDLRDEDMIRLKRDRVLSTIPSDAKGEFLARGLNESDTEILKKSIENDIHKISMTPNITDQNFMGNSSGVAIKYKLLAFEQNIANKERYMEKGLMQRFELYNNFLSTSSKMEIVPVEEVDALFKRNLPSNDFEISQMINNLSGTGLIDKETLAAQLSFITDAKEIVALAEAESQPQPTEKKLGENEIPDANKPDEIPNE